MVPSIMSKRQSSTTSLSRYARPSSPVQNPSMDFCNSFWGPDDAGCQVLFARMRGAIRTVDELANFWKERFAIEDDYAKKLGKLAKSSLGRDEIGDLRNALDTIRLETDKQAGFHAKLAQEIRNEIDAQAATFAARQADFKKRIQAAVERELKAKQQQEAYVLKARDKYEQDCMRINSYTAQSTLVQGKDLEKILLKLDRAKATVGSNQRDFANFARTYAESTERWEMIWADYCDKAQDLEEDRIDFVKDNLWGYANAISQVCVSDDESCERIRVVLETVFILNEQENFVRDYGTGNQIPDPHPFVDYNSPDAIPSSSSKPRSHFANFMHVNDSMWFKKEQETRYRMQQDDPIEEDLPPELNTAGIGAPGNKQEQPIQSLSRQPSKKSVHRKPTPEVSREQDSFSSGYNSQPRGSGKGETAMEDTYIKVGPNAYRVDPNMDPQQQAPKSTRNSSSPVKGLPNDPLAKTLEDLRSDLSATGTVRRHSVWKSSSSSASQQQQPLQTSSSSSSSSQRRQAAQSSTPPQHQQRASLVASAEMVVGSYPSSSRPASPNPPTAVFMSPTKQSTDSEDVQGVLNDYQQSLPGERKSISRRGSYVGPPPTQSQSQNLERPSSQMGHAGVGAHGASRSPSPQPISRAASPAPSPGGYMIPSPSQQVQRTTSPNSVGIALDPSGRVLQDDMAQMYQQHRPSPPQQQHQQPRVTAAPQQPPPQQQQQYGSQGRRVSYIAPPPANYAAPVYQQPSQPLQPVYQQPPPMQYYQPPPPPQQQPPYQPPMNGYVPAQTTGAVVRNGSASYGTRNGSAQYGGGYGGGRQSNGYQQDIRRSMSPQPQPQRGTVQAQASAQTPTGQFTESGEPILFYVQAIFNYTATIDTEFDFQVGDIIAVTATPEDGWWSGELLDESRREKGRHIFPMNFVNLF